MSRGRIVHWLLDELGVPYDMKVLDFEKGEHKKPGYLKINPMGKVPAIVHRGIVVTECGAICVYLADAFPQAGLAPALDDPQRGTYLRWIFFGAGCFEPAIIDKMFARPAVERKGALGYGSYEDTLNALETALKPGPYILGDKLQRGRRLRRRAGAVGFDGQGSRAAPRVPAIRGAHRGAAGVAEVIERSVIVVSAVEQRISWSAPSASARWHASTPKRARSSASSPSPSPRRCTARGFSACGCRSTLRGGLELDPVSSLEVIENVSYGDPSAGWVLMAASLAIGTGAAYLKDAAVKELFGGRAFPVIAGQGTRPGNAKPTKGGFDARRARGASRPASSTARTSTRSASSRARTRRASSCLPVGKAKLIDNWDVLGLRATGSIDYTTDDVFVPDAYTHMATTEDTAARRQPLPHRHHRLRRRSAIRVGPAASAGVCSTSSSPSSPRRPAAPARWPTARASKSSSRTPKPACRSARAFVYETWGDVRATLARGDKLSVRQHTLIRLALAHSTWSAHEAAMFAYQAAGTAALRAGTIQHLFRDMHAGTQHITSSPPVYAAIGRELAGLAKGKKWLFLNLVDQ